MKSYFHYCCRGLKTDLIFADEREFIAGMNRIGVCYLYCLEKGMQVQIIAHCLLSNHFHFVLYGTEEATELFMDYYKHLTGMWIQRYRGEKLHGKIQIDHWAANSPQKAKDKVIYTLRQALEAGLQIIPQGYPWCSAMLMFQDNSFLNGFCEKLENVSGRKKQKMFNTTVTLPDNWKVLPNGMIWPGCYTDTLTAQSLFLGVRDYMYCLNNGNIDKAVNAEMMTERPSIPDSEIRDRAKGLSKGLFGNGSLSNCSAEERIRIAQLLRKELHCGHKQLARIIMMDEAELRKFV